MSYGYVTPTGGWTIELWFKSDALSSTYRTLFNQRTQASVSWSGFSFDRQGRQLILEVTPAGALSFQFMNEGSGTGVNLLQWTDAGGAGYANDNQWHHVALRMSTDKKGWAIYLDGTVLGSGTLATATNWKPGILTFGAQYAPHLGDFGSYVWDKWLAYIGVYNKPLTFNRILEHYTAGSGGTVYYGDNEVTRMQRIADWAEVPDQSLEFDSPVVVLQGIQVEGTNALTAFQDSAAAASGLIFADGQSRLVYHNRRHRYNRWVARTFSETNKSAPEIGLTFTIDDANIYNDIRGDRPYGSTVRLQDAVSKASHGRKTYSFSIPVTTHEELRNAVAWLSSQYAEPRVRVSDVTFKAESSDDIEWMATGGITIGDHIVIDELPGEAAPMATMEFVVEKISAQVNVKTREWEVSLELSPFELSQVFQVGVSTLGPNYVVAY